MKNSFIGRKVVHWAFIKMSIKRRVRFILTKTISHIYITHCRIYKNRCSNTRSRYHQKFTITLTWTLMVLLTCLKLMCINSWITYHRWIRRIWTTQIRNIVRIPLMNFLNLAIFLNFNKFNKILIFLLTHNLWNLLWFNITIPLFFLLYYL